MTKSHVPKTSDQHGVHLAWSDYWDGEADADGALTSDVHADRLTAYWQSVFEDAFAGHAGPMRMLDAACGTGVLAKTAAQLAAASGRRDIDIVLTDVSVPALAAAKGSGALAGAHFAAADACALPFHPRSMDLVVSQFGLEYAGLAGFASAMDVVRGGGLLACVIHNASGGLAAECAGNLRVLDRVEEAGLIPAFLALFRAIHESAPEAEVKRLAADAAQSGGLVASALEAAPAGAAKAHASQLLIDMQAVMNRIRNYSVEDIQAWAGKQSVNLAAYRLRMRSMIAAAMDEAEMQEISGMLAGHGFETVEVADFPSRDGLSSMAWTLTARRKAD